MMNQSGSLWTVTGAVLAALAVAAGAFAAHGLDGYFAQKYADTPAKKVAGVEVPAPMKYLQDFKTGAEYQMYHALGLIGVGVLLGRRDTRSLHVAAWCFVGGIILFSGCLYLLTLTGVRVLGAIVPIGGTLFLVGWGALAWGTIATSSAQPTAVTPSA